MSLSHFSFDLTKKYNVRLAMCCDDPTCGACPLEPHKARQHAAQSQSTQALETYNSISKHISAKLVLIQMVVADTCNMTSKLMSSRSAFM